MPESSRPRTRSITGNRAGRWVVALVILLAVGVGGWLWRWRQVAPESEITKPYHQAPDQAQRAPSESLPTDVHPLDPALDFARQVRDRMIRDIHDYTAKIIKRERIKGKLGSEDYMQVKIRHADFAAQPPIPFSVFLRNVEPSSAAGREVIWIRGQNDDKLLTHQFGLTLKLPTDGMLACLGSPGIGICKGLELASC
ncbi:MAG: DUF1571 domain-containing protein [Pirellulaceae bacterium]|nr:DUF1571 domain-containing protein [Pirellulaceae bacterium]